MKLHLGNGDVFLEGYCNCDLGIEGYSFLASDRPDLVEKNRTTFDHYYKNLYSREGPRKDRLCVCDRFMDARQLLFPPQSVDEILMVQLFEHFDRWEVRQVLSECRRVLKPTGTLVIDVPDFEGVVRELLVQADEASKEYYYRMVFGSQKNPGAYHKDGYSEAKLTTVLEANGFPEVWNLGNILMHPYPSVTVGARCEWEGYHADELP